MATSKMKSMMNRKKTTTGMVTTPVIAIKKRVKRLYETKTKKVKFFKTERTSDRYGAFSVVRFKIMDR